MIWIPIVVFAAVGFIVGGVLLLMLTPRGGGDEIRKRLSLIELRSIDRGDLPDVLKKELLSDVPAINQILAHFQSAVRIDRRLRQADLTWKVGTFLFVSLILFALGVLAGILLHWPLLLAFAVGAVLLALPSIVVDVLRHRRMKAFLFHFPDALEMFARSLRAGHSFTGAIQLVAQEMPDPIGPEFQKVFEEQNLGIPLRQALVSMIDRVDLLDVKFFVTAILIQRETGGNLAEIIDKISYVIRERFRIQGQVRVFTAQARLTGYILTALPIALALIIMALNPNYLRPLWFEKFGRFLIGLGVVLQVTGAFIIRKIIRIKI